MTHSWLLNAIGLFATTVGALLLLMHLMSPPRFTNELQTAEAKKAYALYHRRVVVAVGLLSLWLVLQDIAVILS